MLIERMKNLRFGRKKKFLKKLRFRKDGIDKKEILVNEFSRGNGRL